MKTLIANIFPSANVPENTILSRNLAPQGSRYFVAQRELGQRLHAASFNVKNRFMQWVETLPEEIDSVGYVTDKGICYFQAGHSYNTLVDAEVAAIVRGVTVIFDSETHTHKEL